MARHGGVYRKRKFTQDAIDTTPAFGIAIQAGEIGAAAVTSAKVESELKTHYIHVQYTADSITHIIPKPMYPITVTEAKLIGSAAGSGTTLSELSVTLLLASSGFGTTATICPVLNASTSVGASMCEDSATAIAQAVAATQALMAVWGATTLFDAGAGLAIAYTID